MINWVSWYANYPNSFNCPDHMDFGSYEIICFLDNQLYKAFTECKKKEYELEQLEIEIFQDKEAISHFKYICEFYQNREYQIECLWGL